MSFKNTKQLSSTRIGDPFPDLKVIGVSTAPIVFVIGNVFLVPSNKSSNVFNFSNSPKVNPAKLSLKTSRTVREKVLNALPADASVKIPDCPPSSIERTSSIL